MHSRCDSEQLGNHEQATDYYDHRYAGDYMQDWPADKLERVADVIRSLNLGETGTAIDFGCGVGVFSRVLADALPNWTVIGLEISPNAIASAKAQHPDIDFRLLQDTDLNAIRADFVLSHHVLEHVIDLDQTWQQHRDFCKDGARVLHILPCGDAHSLEHRLAMKTRDGIEPAAGNRFFYEDAGHVRRLTWQDLCDAGAPAGFQPDQVRYANRLWGGLSWISKIAPEKAAAMARPQQANSTTNRAELLFWRFIFRGLATMNRWASVWDWRKQHANTFRRRVSLWATWPMGFVGHAICGGVDRLAQDEWGKGRLKTGSEMYAVMEFDQSKAAQNHIAHPTRDQTTASTTHRAA